MSNKIEIVAREVGLNYEDIIKCAEWLYENIIKCAESKERNSELTKHFRTNIDIILYSTDPQYLFLLVTFIPNLGSDKNIRLLDLLAIKGDFESTATVFQRLPDLIEEMHQHVNVALLKASRYPANLGVVKILHNSGKADINCFDADKNSPLHWAVDAGACDIIRYLVYNEANVDATNINNETPLHWAAVLCNENRKAKFVDPEIEHWYNKLKVAGIKKKLYLAIALNLVNDALVDTHIKSVKNETAVGIIAREVLSSSEYNEQQKILILNSIQPDRGLREQDIELTSLTSACKEGNLIQIEYLLKSKVSLNYQDEEGYTGLHWLAESNSYLIAANARKRLKLKQLIDKYVSLVDARDLTDIREKAYKNSVFLHAAMFGTEDMVDAILKKCGKSVLDQKNGGNKYGLHLAAANGYPNVLKVLVENGDDINKTADTDESTALHYAVVENTCDAIEFLIESGANVNKKNKSGLLPVFLAIMHWNAKDKETKCPDKSSKIGFWYKQLKKIGFTNCINLAIACYFVNDCKAQLSSTDSNGETTLTITNMLKRRIDSSEEVNLNQTQREFLHRFIISMDRSSEIVYRNLSEPRGYCIIANNIEIEGEAKRSGSELDAEKLEILFKDLKFDVKTEHNLESLELEERLSFYSKSEELENHDALVVIVMSHGGADYVLGKDGIPIDIRRLISMFNNENCLGLKGKPKIFILEACRGTVDQKGVGTDYNDAESSKLSDGGNNSYTLHAKQALTPETTDVLICYATLYGQSAFRPNTGAWYCQALYTVLTQEYHKHDLLTILSNVDKEVQKETLQGKYKQTTSYENNGFNKKFFFNVREYQHLDALFVGERLPLTV